MTILPVIITTILVIEVLFMDKEEILKKSREQKEDEGVTFAENKGQRFGIVGFASVFVIIVFFNLFTGQNNFVPFTMFWAYAAAEAYGEYSVTKKKSYLVTAIFAGIAAVCFLATYILKTLWSAK